MATNAVKILPALLLLIVAVAGCVTVAPQQRSGTSEAAGVPQIAVFGANPSSIQPGDMITLQWEVTNATSASIDQGIGSVALRGNRAVSPLSTVTYKLTATNQYGTASATANVVVATPPVTAPAASNLPEVMVFAATPANIASGQTAILSWQVRNSFDVSISPGLSIIPPSGSAEISPIIPTTYRLTATNGQGSIVASTTLTVSATLPTGETPVIKFLTADPYVIRRGGSATLSWQSVGASSASIDNGIGIVDGSGTTQVTPSQTTTYMLTVTNPQGAQFQTVTVNVK
jgi:hypothetical protein